MQLTYRGQTYTQSMPHANLSEMPEEGLFLGARFKFKRSHVHRQPQPPVLLTYRGAKYLR